MAAAETVVEEREGVQAAAKAVEGREGVQVAEGLRAVGGAKAEVPEAVSIRSKKRRFHQV